MEAVAAGTGLQFDVQIERLGHEEMVELQLKVPGGQVLCD